MGWDKIYQIHGHAYPQALGIIIIAYSEKLSDIVVLKKCQVYSTNKANIAFSLA